MKELKNKKVESIHVSNDGDVIIFCTLTGMLAYQLTAGDPAQCCNLAFFSAIDNVDCLKDSEIYTVTPISNLRLSSPEPTECGAHVDLYGYRLHTGTGECVIEWRCEQHSWYQGACRLLSDSELLQYFINTETDLVERDF